MSAAPESLAPLARLGVAAAALGGGEHAAARRQRAAERLLALGLPTARDDAWKYTNLRLLARRPLEPAPRRPLPADALAALPARSGMSLVFVDGRLHGSLSDAPPRGVQLTPLAALLDTTQPAERESRLGADDGIDSRVRLLNAALLEDGAWLEVGADAASGFTLNVVHVSTGGGAYPRLVVSLAPGARAELIEYHLSVGDADSLSVPVADVELGAGAELRHHSLALGHPRAIRLEDVVVRVGADARYLHRHVALGGQIGRLDLRVELAAPGAATELAGLFIAREQRQLDVRTLVRHRAPRTRSEQLYRGVAGERGRGSYDGKVVVHAGAAKADSRQSSRNLLLSAQARIDTRPQLEINADDVKCSHGATTGTLDEQMLFYLLARGLEPDTARALLTFAFADDVIALLGIPALRRFTEERVLGNLPAAELIREFVQ
jgi:Fe-S cluster assembly protein SufD